MLTLSYNSEVMEDSNTCIRDKANPVQINECRKAILAGEKSFKGLSDILGLAGNEVRLKILYLLNQEQELCPCDLSDILGMTIPAVSQHLRKMKEGNVISFRREGQTIFYSLKAAHMDLLHPFFNIINRTDLIAAKA